MTANRPRLAADVLMISLGTTRGLRIADAALADAFRAAGASVEVAAVRVGALSGLRRGYPANDVIEALAARRATVSALAGTEVRALVLSTTTAAMLAPPTAVPFAVRFDCLARVNRPGALSAPLRPVERRRLRQARVLMPMSRGAANAIPAGSAPSVVIPARIASGAARGPAREPIAIAYTPDPKAKGLDLVSAAWTRAAVDHARLHVFGIDAAAAREYLHRAGVPEPVNVDWMGMTDLAQFHRALRRASVFVSGARWEDFGLAPLEALANGMLLVCAPSPGPFDALGLARELNPDLVAVALDPGALGDAIGAAFSLPPPTAARYSAAARELLVPYSPEAVASAAADALTHLLD